MAKPSPESRPAIGALLLRPLNLGVLGVGGAVGIGAFAAAGAVGSVLPAIGIVTLTGLAYAGLVGADLLFAPAPPSPAREPDDLDQRLAAVETAAARLGPLLDAGGPAMVEAGLSVQALVHEARETAARTRSVRELLSGLSIEELDADVKQTEREVAAARDEAARTLLHSALTARKARRAGRRSLVGLEERGRAALTLAESVLEEMGTRLGRLVQEGGGDDGAGVLPEVERLHRELSTLQAATAATLAEMGAIR